MQQEAEHLLKQVGLGAYLHAFPRELSGGMRRRLNWVRTALLHRPIVLLDEPLVGLDPLTKNEMYTIMEHLFHDQTLVMVTHQQEEADRLTSRSVLLHFEEPMFPGGIPSLVDMLPLGNSHGFCQREPL
jgi:glycine betaine/proline transport system ATP-binding protein